MAENLKQGEHVEWGTPQGRTEGTVKKKLTEPTKTKSHAVKASKDNPEYLVETDQSHKEAAHKPSELKKDGE